MTREHSGLNFHFWGVHHSPCLSSLKWLQLGFCNVDVEKLCDLCGIYGVRLIALGISGGKGTWQSNRRLLSSFSAFVFCLFPESSLFCESWCFVRETVSGLSRLDLFKSFCSPVRGISCALSKFRLCTDMLNSFLQFCCGRLFGVNFGLRIILTDAYACRWDRRLKWTKTWLQLWSTWTSLKCVARNQRCPVNPLTWYLAGNCRACVRECVCVPWRE